MKQTIKQIGKKLNQHVKETYYKHQHDSTWEEQIFDHIYLFGLPLDSDELLHFSVYLGKSISYTNEDGTPSDALALVIGLPFTTPNREQVEQTIFDTFTELVKESGTDTFVYLRGDLENERLFGGERPTGPVSEQKILIRN